MTSSAYPPAMTGSTRLVSRRTFLRDLGHGAFALTIVGLAGCTRTAPSSPTPTGSFDPLTYVGNLDEIESIWCFEELPPAPPVQGAVTGSWARIGHRGGSAYVLVRGGEATVVDTGAWCVPDVIEGGLTAVGLDWSAVGSVIVTHKHPDHWVGLTTALDHAPSAVAYAGAADIPHIASPRPVLAVGAGDRVMDLAIIPTPGHTPGHIAVHDEAAGVLVVGDAIVYNRGGGFLLAPTSEDLAQTQASVGILAGLSFDTLLPGHGDPIIGGASEELSAYVAGNVRPSDPGRR
jgi:glyoxylase-like metal-dependent hydrolase (beta-lactamase superfamily II)